jgi:acylphosphatase
MPINKGSGRRRALFSGNVQGVGFRYRTVQVARRFPLAGFVRNLSDGRVELVVEGDLGELDRFLASIQSEMNDFIADVQIETSPATGEFDGFEMRV